MKEGGECRKPSESGGSGSRRDRGRPRDTYVFSPMLDYAGDPPLLHGPRGPIATTAAPSLRALVHKGGLGMSSSKLPTLL